MNTYTTSSIVFYRVFPLTRGRETNKSKVELEVGPQKMKVER
jgi:hypothetical protein